MKIICHEREHKRAEIIAEDLIFHGADEAVMLVGELYYQGYDVIIWHQNNLPADFLIFLREWQEKSFKIFQLPNQAGYCR